MIKAPTRPRASPTTRRELSFSVRNTSTAIGKTINGVVAFQSPASNEDTWVSP